VVAPLLSRRYVVLGASALALLLTPSTLCLAQSAPPATTRLLVQVTRVKPDMLNEWLDLQRTEVNAAYRKAEIPERTVSVPVLGNTYEYLSVSPLKTLGIFDGPPVLIRALGPEAGARLQAKLRRCIDGTQIYQLLRVDELSSLPDRSKPAPGSVSTRRRIPPGKLPEYEAFVKAEIIPVYRKAKADGKIAGFGYTRRSLGASAGEVAMTVYVNKFVDIDTGNPLAQVLGQAAAAKINAKGAGLSTVVETVVRRRVAELSY
jgi:hypothetical protein